MYYDDVNEVRLSGNLVRNPEQIVAKDDSSFVKVQLATNESWLHADERKTHTEFTTVLFNNKADAKMAFSLAKGDKVYVAGKLRLRRWQGDDGVARVTAVIMASIQGLRILKKQNAAKPATDEATVNS